jgi:hypothetical protein
MSDLDISTDKVSNLIVEVIKHMTISAESVTAITKLSFSIGEILGELDFYRSKARVEELR